MKINITKLVKEVIAHFLYKGAIHKALQNKVFFTCKIQVLTYIYSGVVSFPVIPARAVCLLMEGIRKGTGFRIKSGMTTKSNVIACLLPLFIIGLLFSFSYADDIDPHYKFSGVKTPDSPYKNTWGAYQTDLFSGSFNYEYKIDVPPGTNGLTPKVSLSYNSHSAKGKAGWIGAGWEIPLSHIQRDIEYTRKDTTDDTFDLFLEGSKHDLIYVPSEDRYHTKIESYLKIEKKAGAPNESGEYWLVTTKDGTEYRFGYNLDSENMVGTMDTSITPYVWRWSLDQIKDPNGNCIYFTYVENPASGSDRGAVYLSKIEYNNEKKRVIEFVLESSDKPDMYRTMEQGSYVREARRLSEIRISVNGSLARKYTFAYSLNEAQNKSLLTTITQYGADGVSTLPPVKFEYKALDKEFNAERSWGTQGERWIRKVDSDNDVVVDTFDVNGDGLPDLVSFDGDHWDVWFNNRVRFVEPSVRWYVPSGWDIRDVESMPDHTPNARSSPIDIDHDGMVDFLWAYDSTVLQVKKNTGSGFAGTVNWNLPVSGAWIREVQKPDGVAANVKQDFMDMNGDGLPDIVKKEDDHHWRICFNNGTGFPANRCEVWPVPHSMAWLEDFTRDVANLEIGRFDMNGDGLPDIVDSAGGTWKIYMNTGSNFIYIGDWPTTYSGVITDIDSTGNVKRDLIDINGDGLPDIVNPPDGSSIWQVQLNKGDGFTDRISWPAPSEVRPDGYTRDVTKPDSDGNVFIRRDIFDIDGDGVADIVRKTADNWKVYTNKSGQADLLSKITETLGGTVTINYTSSMGYSNTRESVAQTFFNWSNSRNARVISSGTESYSSLR